jgi:hypothetical protein
MTDLGLFYAGGDREYTTAWEETVMTNTNAEQTNHTAAANEDSEGRRCHLSLQKFFGVVPWIGSLPNTGLW